MTRRRNTRTDNKIKWRELGGSGRRESDFGGCILCIVCIIAVITVILVSSVDSSKSSSSSSSEEKPKAAKVDRGNGSVTMGKSKSTKEKSVSSYNSTSKKKTNSKWVVFDGQQQPKAPWEDSTKKPKSKNKNSKSTTVSPDEIPGVVEPEPGKDDKPDADVKSGDDGKKDNEEGQGKVKQQGRLG